MSLFIYFGTQIYEWFEQKKVQRRFYSKERFRKLDGELLKNYHRHNPYLLSKAFLLGKGEKIVDCYGETPLTTLEKIVRECEITSKDTVIEMGSGRGRASLFLAEYVGCKVIGYEWNPIFIKKMVSSPSLQILHQDMFEADFSKASVIFLYGTMLNDSQIQILLSKFPFFSKIITVSYSLNEYSRLYRTIKSFSGRFPWGKTEVFWNERTR